MMKTIIIDPGHGGSDPGAVNKGLNVLEKDINLDVSKQVYEKLKEYNCKVLMTRNTDTYLSLTDRTTKSNNNNCDRFISIHCNSFADEKVNGYEIWVYNKGNNANIGNDILSSFSKNIKGSNRGIKENTQFTVLAKTKCKAVLIELGFISNTNECKHILNEMDKYVNSIVEGIVNNLKLTKKQECCCKCHN